MDIVVAYLHYLSILVIASCLAAEFALLADNSLRSVIARLSHLDMLYFLALGLALLSGFARFGTSSKGLMYYAGNPLFWVKLLLFGVLAALSMIPTRRYSRWRHQVNMDSGFRMPADEAQSTRIFVASELAIIVLMPLVAVFMARGVGFAA